jgi:hypothetical protein
LEFDAANSQVKLSGVVIGTFTNTNGELSISFNSNGTQARVNEALSSIGYANSSDAPPASVVLQWVFSDGNTGAQGAGGAQNATGTTTVNITSVDDPQVLDTVASAALPSILEGAINPEGMTIGALIVDGSVTDVDGTAVEAIAIEGLNTSLGAWQYKLEGTSQWLTIRADLINSTTNTLSLLLGPNDSIRLLPYGDLNGTLSDADLDEIYTTYLSPTRLTDRIDKVGSQVMGEIEQVMAMIDAAAGSA